MSEEELKQIWDNLFNKLNETEKTYLAIVSNEKNKQIEELKTQLQQEENIIKEVREYIMTELITEWNIKNGGCVSGSDLPVDAIIPILEILDKDITKKSDYNYEKVEKEG